MAEEEGKKGSTVQYRGEKIKKGKLDQTGEGDGREKWEWRRRLEAKKG